jgi:hypothetical protein
MELLPHRAFLQYGTAPGPFQTVAAACYAAPLPFHKAGKMQTKTGRAARVATPYKLKIGNKFARVYGEHWLGAKGRAWVEAGQERIAVTLPAFATPEAWTLG